MYKCTTISVCILYKCTTIAGEGARERGGIIGGYESDFPHLSAYIQHTKQTTKLPSYYYYFDVKLHHVSHEKIIEIINEWSTLSQK